MSGFSILSLVTFLPVISGILLFFVNSKNDRNYYYFAIAASLVNFILSLKLLGIDLTSDSFQLVEKFNFLDGYDIKYALGIDGISALMIVLTTFLVPICLLVSIDAIKERVKEYVIAFLIMEGSVIGSFAAIDLLLFYIFFEAMLIPMFLIIGIWGGKDRIYAAYKFFLYTLFGSVFFLTAIIYIYLRTGTTDLILLKKFLPHLTFGEQKWLWLAFFVSFAIKIPMFPVHTWLPDAHVQAPTAGSIILAGILIKLGAYGLIRFSLPFFPLACTYFATSVFILSVIAIIYASLVALMQEDMKKMIAYSSVAHMGFVTIGIFSFTVQGLQGAIMQMISHGLISSALFLSVGVLYNRLHTKLIADFGGIAARMPNFSWLVMVFVLGSVGLPGTSGFIGEFLAIIGVFLVNKIIAILAAIGVILGACYMLWLTKRVFFGEITSAKVKALKDLNFIEFISLATMSSLVIIFGIFPNLILTYLNSPIATIIKLYQV